MKKFSALIGAIGVAIALAGCAGGTPAAGPSAATESATRTGSPTPPPTVVSIVIGGDAVRFVDSAGASREVGYTAPVAEALSAVKEALGPQTGTKEYPGTNHTVPATSHDFGAFSVVENHYPDAVEHTVLVAPKWDVRTTAAQIGAVAVTTSTGLAVGSSVEDVPGHADPDRLSVFTVGGKVSAFILVEASSGAVLVPDGTTAAVGVLASASAWPGPITMLSAPAQFGGA